MWRLALVTCGRSELKGKGASLSLVVVVERSGGGGKWGGGGEKRRGRAGGGGDSPSLDCAPRAWALLFFCAFDDFDRRWFGRLRDGIIALGIGKRNYTRLGVPHIYIIRE